MKLCNVPIGNIGLALKYAGSFSKEHSVQLWMTWEFLRREDALASGGANDLGYPLWEWKSNPKTSAW